MTENQDRWRIQALVFFAGQCISLFGSQIVQMAIVWYATLYTGSGAWVAAFSLGSYLPQFFISFLGGVWADRHPRKALILAADAGIAAVTLVMLLIMPYVTEGTALLAALLMMCAIRSAGAGIQGPAVSAVIPQLVPKAHRMRYNGIHAAMQASVQFAAPAAAAMVLSVYSLRETMIIDIVTAGIGMGLLACLRLPKGERARQPASVWAEMTSGARYAYGCVQVRKTLLIYGLFLFLSVPAGYLAGLHVSRAYGETVWYLTAVELVGFGGMAAGGVIMSLWGGFKHHWRTLAFGLALFGAMAMAMSVSCSFAAYLVFMAVYGVAMTVVQTTITTMLQSGSEEAMQGRVFGLMGALYAGCYPMGMALFGPMADQMPLPGMMFFSGAALLAVAVLTGCDVHLKGMASSKQ